MAAEPLEYCRFCEDQKPAARDGMCWGHLWRKRNGKTVAGPLLERPLDPRERLRKAAETFVEATSGDADSYERADNNLLKAALSIRKKSFVEAVQAGQQRAKRRGVHVGRPPVAEPERVAELVAAKGIRATARELKVSRGAVKRALKSR